MLPKRIFFHSIRIAVALLALLVLGNLLQAQTATTTPTPVDPGPRPVGTQGAINFCPGLQQAKFPGAPACIDVNQPAAGGAGGAGNIVANAGDLQHLWFDGLTVFETSATIGGTVSSVPAPQTGGSSIPGLGPSFNAVSCFQCHSQPAVGGSSPNTDTPGFANGNPQLGDAPTTDQQQAVAPFILPNGPVREVRFPKVVAASGNTAAVVGGSVAELFVVTPNMNGGAAIPNCSIGQEPFATETTNNNIIFRIPIPTFGDGFVEATPDANLRANRDTANAIAANTKIFNPALGLNGLFNLSGNDQTINRFGWKAQNKSLLMFAGEASNVEMGVTNELFPNERTIGNGNCTPNLEPEDQTLVLPDPTDPNSRTVTTILSSFGADGVSSDISSNIENFAVFMRLNAAPSQCDYQSTVTVNGDATVPVCNSLSASAKRGAALFGTMGALEAFVTTPPATPFSPTNPAIVGCVLCHIDTQTSGPSRTPGLSNQTFHPFSDFALHTMDPDMADGVVTQGSASGQQFRSAPLWGGGQRLFFMHDGGNGNNPTTAGSLTASFTPLSNALYNAIEAHCLNPIATTPSEACKVIAIFNALPATSGANCQPNGTNCVPSQQDILNFLRSL